MSNGYITLRGHHLNLLYWLFIEKCNEETLISYTTHYGKKYNENKREILRRLKKPGVSILVTDTTDDLCKACPQKEEHSKEYPDYSMFREDRLDLRQYGLEVGKIYPLDYLIKVIRPKWF